MQASSPLHAAAQLKQRLDDLASEQHLAAVNGLAGNPLYAADLAGEVQAVRAAYVGAAVTEIATLRAALDGPLQG